MSLGSSLLMFEDVRKALEEAMSKEIGIEIIFETKGEAVQFRQRCYAFRGQHRKINAAAFDENDPRSKESIYDNLLIIMKANVLEIRRRDTILLQVRELKS